MNNPDHGQDGHSNDGPSRDECLASGTWSDTPDATVYAIFRKVGDELPKFVDTVEDAISTVAVEKADGTAVYTISGQQAGKYSKGIIIQKGKKVLVK